MSTPTTQGADPKKFSIVKWYKSVLAEFKKVIWPTPKELKNYTLVVFGMSIFFMICLFTFDSVFHTAFKFLIK